MSIPNSKSIGWLPVKLHYPDAKELAKNGWPEGTIVFDEWLLVEYAVGAIPVNPETVVEVVSKLAHTTGSPSFTPWAEIQKSIHRKLTGIDFAAMTRNAIGKVLRRV